MSKFRISFFLALACAAAFAQTASEYEAPQVNRVAEKLSCPCGCALNMTCKMEPYMCGTCKRAKTKIIAMQAAGKSDSQILDQFVKEEGKQILVVPPGVMGVAGPVAAVLLGLGAVALVMRRYRRPHAAAGPEVDPAMLERIDKEMNRLD